MDPTSADIATSIKWDARLMEHKKAQKFRKGYIRATLAWIVNNASLLVYLSAYNISHLFPSISCHIKCIPCSHNIKDI